MVITRKRERTIVDIAVTITTVLDSLDARIIDLSEHGAQIVGASLPRGAKFQIEYMGHIIYAQCMWSEIDRMGIRFPFDLTDGPLHDALMMAMPPAAPDKLDSFMAPASLSSLAPRRPVATGFGRRTMV